MKKTRNILLSLIAVISLTACGNSNNNNENVNQGNEQNVNGEQIAEYYLTDFEVERVKESKYDMPAFTLKIDGEVNKTINSNSLRNLKVYDFVTYKTDDYLTNERAYEVRYSGIKVIDVLEYLEVDSYSELKLIDNEGGEILLPASKIDKDSYLAFYQNGIQIGEGRVDFVIPGMVDIFWGQGLKSITIIK